MVTIVRKTNVRMVASAWTGSSTTRAAAVQVSQDSTAKVREAFAVSAFLIEEEQTFCTRRLAHLYKYKRLFFVLQTWITASATPVLRVLASTKTSRSNACARRACMVSPVKV